MKDSNYRWSTLLRKYLRKEITDNELKALHELINNDPEKMRQFRRWTDPQEFSKQLQHYNNINTERSWEKLAAKRKAPPTIDPETMPVKKGTIKQSTIFGIVITVAAAAAFIIFLFRPQQLPKSNTLITALNPKIKGHTYIRETSGREHDLEDNNGYPSLGSFVSNLIYQNNSLKILAGQDNYSKNDTELDLVTAPEKQMQVEFTDGSSVKLNSASALRFPLAFNKTARSVQMNGEAFFNVATNRDVPFVVSLSNGVQVKATGTSFNISTYDAGRVVMTLLTGTVEMIYGNIQMTVHERAQVEFTQEKKFRLIKQPNLEQATAWINYEFNFNNKDIKEVIQEIGRYYNYKVIFKGPISPMAASGIFDIKKQNLTKIISAIEQLYLVDITPEGNTLIVSQVGQH